MEPMQVQLLYGPRRGQRLALRDSPTGFGREPKGGIVVPLKFASRKHGEFRLSEGQWELVNLSPNGTLVNGRKVSKRAQPLKHGDVVKIGDTAVMKVLLESLVPVPPPKPGQAGAGEDGPVYGEADAVGYAAGEAETEPPGEVQDGGEGQGQGQDKAKRWILLGVYMIGMLLLIPFLGSLRSEEEAGPQGVPELTQQEIRDAITAEVAVEMQDPRLVREHLEAANELYARLEVRDDALYQAYRHYQLAMAHSETPKFDVGMDQIRFREVEQRLIERVSEMYREGYTQLRAGQYREAMQTFDGLIEMYPNRDSVVVANAERQMRVARQALASG